MASHGETVFLGPRLDMVDAFRWLNPEAAGMYTYWSRSILIVMSGRFHTQKVTYSGMLLCYLVTRRHVMLQPIRSQGHRLRPVNKGLRLDYFLLSRFIAEGTTQARIPGWLVATSHGLVGLVFRILLDAKRRGVRVSAVLLLASQVTLQDCRILSKYGGSDHCPVVCSMFI